MINSVRIVIVGSGFGGTYALETLHKKFCGGQNVKIDLVSEEDYFLFTPLLHEVATGGVSPESVAEPIGKELRCCLNNFHKGKVKFVSLKEKFVEIEGLKIFYDYLVLAPGAETNFYNTSGARENSFTLKSLEDALKIKSLCCSRIRGQKTSKITVVGGGPTGVELAAELKEYIKEGDVTLIQKEKELMPQFSKKIREKSLEVLKGKGIKVMLGKTVKAITPTEVLLEEGEQVASDLSIWVAGIKPVNLEFDRAVRRSKEGKLAVNKFLELEGEEKVFAVGDVALFKEDGSPLPALAQVASKQGSHAAKNIYRLIQGKRLKPFRYHHSGTLVSLGQWMAVGEILGIFISGRLTWVLWRAVYLFKIISWEKRLGVARDWAERLFHPRDY